MLAAADMGYIDAFVPEIIGDIGAELVVGHAAEEADLIPQAGHAHRDVGRGAAEILVEIRAFVQGTVIVRGVEGDGDPADKHDAQGTGEVEGDHDRSSFQVN